MHAQSEHSFPNRLDLLSSTSKGMQIGMTEEIKSVGTKSRKNNSAD